MNLGTYISFAQTLPRLNSYSPEQPRDKDGRWATGDEGDKVFVSPNVEENLHISDALRQLGSDRQQRFEAKEREIVSAVAGSGTVQGALGVWADGAENSTAVTLGNADPDKLRYTAALLGKAGAQKAVLAWQHSADGPSVLYTLTSSKPPQEIAADAMKLGIEFQTIVPGVSTTIHVMDSDGSLASKLETLGGMAGYTPVSAQRGHGEFIGSWTSREEGNAAYEKVIQDYEQKRTGYKGSLQFSDGKSDQRGDDLRRWIEAKEINTFCRCGHTLAQHLAPDFGCKYCGPQQCPGFMELRAYSDDEPRDNKGEWTTGQNKMTAVNWAMSKRAKDAVYEAGFKIELAHPSRIHPSEYDDWRDAKKQLLLDSTRPYEARHINDVTEKMKDGKGVFPLLAVKEADGDFTVLDGHHRYLAAKQVNPKTYMALVTGPDNHDARMKLSDLLDKASQEDEADGIKTGVVQAFNPDEARDKKGEWTKDGERDRATAAKATYNPATYEKQKIADAAEQELTKAVGIPRTKDNSAFDLLATGIGVEVKTLVDRKRNEITMHPESLLRKKREARKSKLATYTVVMDKRPGQNKIYWRAGVGSFHLAQMNVAQSFRELKKALVPK